MHFFKNLLNYVVIIIIICIIYKLYLLYELIYNNKTVELFSSDKWESIIDGIVYINLDKRTDRKKELLTNLKKYNVPSKLIHRIPAVYDKMCGHLGCSKSHIKALDYAERKQWNRFLILEDDFIFKEDKSKVQDRIVDFYDKYKYDCLMLASHYLNTKDTDIPYVKKVVSGTTTSGYIVPKHYIPRLKLNFIESRDKLETEVAERLKKDPKQKIYQTGNAIDVQWMPLQEKDNWYIIQLGTQSNSMSEIMK